jgi:hypothetical protein
VTSPSDPSRRCRADPTPATGRTPRRRCQVHLDVTVMPIYSRNCRGGLPGLSAFNPFATH